MLLADEAAGLLLRRTICLESQSLDVGVGGGAVIAIVALDFADLHHLGRRDRKAGTGVASGSRLCRRKRWVSVIQFDTCC